MVQLSSKFIALIVSIIEGLGLVSVFLQRLAQSFISGFLCEPYVAFLTVIIWN